MGHAFSKAETPKEARLCFFFLLKKKKHKQKKVK
jgi:hypothetical protein